MTKPPFPGSTPDPNIDDLGEFVISRLETLSPAMGLNVLDDLLDDYWALVRRGNASVRLQKYHLRPLHYDPSKYEEFCKFKERWRGSSNTAAAGYDLNIRNAIKEALLNEYPTMAVEILHEALEHTLRRFFALRVKNHETDV